MIIVDPIDITDDNLTASNVTASARAEWDSGTAYVVNDEVKVSFEEDGTTPITPLEFTVLVNNTDKYPIDNADSTFPELETPDWQDDGASNRYKMFDELNGSQTIFADEVDTTVTLGEIANSVTALNVSASSVQVIVDDPTDGEVYNETKTLIADSGINNWYDYYFTPIEREANAVFLDLPAYSAATIQVIFLESSADVKVGVLAFGVQKLIGETDYGTNTGIRSFTTKTQDANGNFKIKPGRFSKRSDYLVSIETDRAGDIQRYMASIDSKAVIFIGDEDFDTTLVYGFYRDFDILLSSFLLSEMTILVEGLT